MKKLIFGLIATVMFGSVGKAQNTPTSKTMIACYTLSCCGFVEFWTVKRCHYVYIANAKNGSSNNPEAGTHTLEFESLEDVKSLKFENDVILANTEADDDTVSVLPKGEYPVINNTITFNANRIKIKKICEEEVNQGSFFGHTYSYTITYCVYYPTWEKRGLIKITPKLSEEELNQIKDTGSEIEFDKSHEIKLGDFSYTLNSGKYFVNPDGNIYIENVNLDK